MGKVHKFVQVLFLRERLVTDARVFEVETAKAIHARTRRDGHDRRTRDWMRRKRRKRDAFETTLFLAKLKERYGGRLGSRKGGKRERDKVTSAASR